MKRRHIKGVTKQPKTRPELVYKDEDDDEKDRRVQAAAEWLAEAMAQRRAKVAAREERERQRKAA